MTENKKVKNKNTTDFGETRRMIVHTAHKLFMEYGYRAVSTRRIADECGLTQPALYHHFSNKQMLYLEVIKTELENTKTGLERILKRYKDTQQVLFHVIYYILLHQPENLNQMFHDMEHELGKEHLPVIARWWEDAYKKPMVSIFQNGMDEGVIRSSSKSGLNAETAAHLLLSMLSQPVKSDMEETSLESIKKSAEKKANLILETILFGLISDQEK